MSDNKLQTLYDQLTTESAREDFVQRVERIDHLVQELASLAQCASEWASQNSYPAAQNYPQYQRVYHLGMEFNQIGGLAGMQAALKSAQKKLGDYPPQRYSYSVIEYGWSGLGEWQP